MSGNDSNSDNDAPVDIDSKLLKTLLAAFEESDWQEMTLTIGGDQLYVSRRDEPRGPVPAVPPLALPSATQSPPLTSVPFAASAPPDAAPVPHPGTTAETVEGTLVDSPSVGLFWRAPAPGAPPFVEVGTQVEKGETLAIVEVMKLMTHVVAPVQGTVKAIVPENGAMVEHGDTLLVIDAGV